MLCVFERELIARMESRVPVMSVRVCNRKPWNRYQENKPTPCAMHVELCILFRNTREISKYEHKRTIRFGTVNFLKNN